VLPQSPERYLALGATCCPCASEWYTAAQSTDCSEEMDVAMPARGLLLCRINSCALFAAFRWVGRHVRRRQGRRRGDQARVTTQPSPGACRVTLGTLSQLVREEHVATIQLCDEHGSTLWLYVRCAMRREATHGAMSAKSPPAMLIVDASQRGQAVTVVKTVCTVERTGMMIL
jgi:hypothetical protein